MDILPIRTGRLLLRPITHDDVDALHRIRGREDVSRYVSHGPLSREDVASMTARDIDGAASSTAEVFRYVWAIERAEDGAVIGTAKTWTTPHPPRPGRLEPGQAALGYALHPDAQRQGYGREAARALVTWLFTERGIRTVFAGVFEPNTASQALLLGLGFTQDRYFSADQDETGKGFASLRFRLDRDDAAWLG